ncbi:hypothetical protein BDN67DRAFT_992549 [Paxillus ammoniavirescens]|nr:hypothetical protein BDN67DRAFT_992549 [Paxillus ammoniavirescens]
MPPKIMPRKRPSATDVTRNMHAALERKKWALHALAEAQTEFEHCRAEMSDIVGPAEVESLCDLYSYHEDDGGTAIGGFVAAAAALTYKPYTISCKAKEVYAQKRKHHQSPDRPTTDSEPHCQVTDHSTNKCVADGQTHTQEQEVVEDNDLPLAQRRSRHLNRRLPLHFHNQLPEPPLPLPPVELQTQCSHPPPSTTSTHTSPVIAGFQNVHSSLRRVFTTQRNNFGLFCLYQAESLPTHDPDDPSDIECSPGTGIHSSSENGQSHSDNPLYPYPNASSLRLGDWYWCQGSRKSKRGFKQLLDIISSPDFHPDDVWSTNWKKIDQKLGSNTFDSDAMKEDGSNEEGWKCKPITIAVPFHSRCQQPSPKEYTTLSNPTQDWIFHYEPYELRWQPPHREHNIRVYGELFTSNAFIEAHQKLQDSPPEPGCDLLHVVAGMMFCSNLCTHVAYFQTLLDDFKGFAMKFSGKPLSDAFFAHCHRELFQQQWKVLFDDEFMEAYQHGIVITCCDGVKRCFYPRIFTYSTDYPEKSVPSCW